ncbi:hypothetical protein LXA43DRAFT_1064989 [Ganoderma leucocontextum]|nr:hypothetical protein LXA43DRAFT_1064989 [Ganoderma leucocontextum]
MVGTRTSARLNPSPSRSPSPSPAPAPKRRSRARAAPAQTQRKSLKERADAGGNAGGGDDVDMLDADVDETPATVKKSGATKPQPRKRKLPETETEVEVCSEATTGNLDHDNAAAVSSELSELEDAKFRGDGEVIPVPVNTSVSNARRKGATTTINKSSTHANKCSVQDDRAKATRPTNNDIAAFMGIPLDVVSSSSSQAPTGQGTSRRTFLVEGSSSRLSDLSGSSKGSDTSSNRTSRTSSRSSGSSTMVSGSSSEGSQAPPRVTRTMAVPPAPIAKPPKPTQAKPFAPDTTMAKDKGKKKAKPHVEQGVARSDTEDAERAAALSSPPKNGARATSQHLVRIKESALQTPHPVKINVLEPTPRKPEGGEGSVVKKTAARGHTHTQHGEQAAESLVEDSDIEVIENASQALQVPRSNRQSRSRSRSQSPGRYRQDDLPKGSQVEKRWKKYFVPTLLQYQGAQLEPWSWVDVTSVPTVQMIWDAIFGDDVPHTVVANDCVHGLATQKLWDWRSSLCHAAEVVVGHYLDANSLTRGVDDRAAFCGKIIEGGRFLYENPLAGNNKARTLPEPVYVDCVNAVDVPGLYSDGTALPIGAMGLGAAALERIFKLYGSRLMEPDDKGAWKVVKQYNPTSGRTSRVRFQGPTNEYAERASKMSDARITRIVDAAAEYTGVKRTTSSDRAPMGEVAVHGRSQLVDEDDD